MVQPGQRTLGDRYLLEALLATGGMGQVWRARDLLLDRPVAVKVLRSEYTGDPTFLARFRAEAQLTARLVHPNIAALHDYGETTSADGEPLAHLVMELVEGESLAALLAREGRLGTARTLDVVGRTADALAAAHAAGVVHRDVKPGNVLLGADGSVKITDFGVAWSAASVPLTRTGQVVGTAHYLSPEQAAGGRACPASDVYALGMIAYECLAGRRAFDGDNPVQIAVAQLRDEPDPLPDDVPGPVRTLVAHALVKDPARRFPDGAAFRAAVDDVLAGRPLPPAPLPTAAFPAPPRPAARRRRLLVPVAALLVGAGVGMGALQLADGTDGVPVAAADPGTGSSAPPDDGVVVTAAPYLGRPADEVEAELAALGLRVQRAPQERVDVPAGLVTGVGPVGALARGDLVTLTVAVAAPVVAVPPEPAPAAPAAPEGHAGAGPGSSTAGGTVGSSGSPGVGDAVGSGSPGGGSGPGDVAAGVPGGAAAGEPDGDSGDGDPPEDGGPGDVEESDDGGPGNGGNGRGNGGNGRGNGNNGNGNNGNGNGNGGNNGNGRGNG